LLRNRGLGLRYSVHGKLRAGYKVLEFSKAAHYT
jgi:hypothetical protein